MPQLQTRAAAQWKPSTFDDKKSKVSAVAATESPVSVYDREMGAVVPEILLMSGVILPESGSVPLLDSHSRDSVSNVLGSARNFQPRGQELIADVYFSGDESGKATAGKVSDGHLSDFSVGYRVHESTWIPEGERETIQGREFKGPVRVSEKWEVRELSLTPVGADQNAKARKEYEMPPENQNTTDAERAEIIRVERERVSEITGMGSTFGCEEIARNLVNSGASEEQARKAIMDHLSRTKADPQTPVRPAYGHYDVGRSDMEKRSAAMIDGMVLRSGLEIEKPAPGADEFRVTSLVDIARESLAMAGKSTRGKSKNDVVREALSTRSHSTSDFPYLLSNVANKVLRDSYELAPSSFEKWVSITDGNDFKEMSRNQISEGPDLDEVAELQEYTYGTFGESKETFQIKTYGKLFAISRQAIVNDDLGAFTRIPRAFAASAKRRINALVYGILVDNPTMADGIALFHDDHGNLHSGADLSTSELSAGRLAMRTQTGLNGATLNISPRFLIVPAASETDADQLINTQLGMDASDGPGVVNPFYRRLDVIVESILDAETLSGAWFLAASPNQIDTVEVCFLDGRRSPYLETQDGWTVDGTEFKARIDVGVAAIDHRGLYKNPGFSE